MATERSIPARRRGARRVGGAGRRAARLGARALPGARRPSRSTVGVPRVPPPAALARARARGDRRRAVLGRRQRRHPVAERLRRSRGGRGRAVAQASRRRAGHCRRSRPGVAVGSPNARPAGRHLVPAHRAGPDHGAIDRTGAASSADVCAVVASSPRHFGSFRGLGDRLASEGYQARRYGPGITVYVRPHCRPGS